MTAFPPYVLEKERDNQEPLTLELTADSEELSLLSCVNTNKNPPEASSNAEDHTLKCIEVVFANVKFLLLTSTTTKTPIN